MVTPSRVLSHLSPCSARTKIILLEPRGAPPTRRIHRARGAAAAPLRDDNSQWTTDAPLALPSRYVRRTPRRVPRPRPGHAAVLHERVRCASGGWGSTFARRDTGISEPGLRRRGRVPT